MIKTVPFIRINLYLCTYKFTTMNKKVTIYVNSEVHTEFQELCRKYKTSVSENLENHMIKSLLKMGVKFDVPDRYNKKIRPTVSNV